MSNIYISIEEVRKIYTRNRYSQKISDGYTELSPNIVIKVLKINAIEEIESLPTIDLSEDKTIQAIDEMIEEYKGNNGNWNADFILEEVKLRLYPNK